MNHENEAAGQPKGVINSEVNTKCLTVVEQYRADQISKGYIILDIMERLLSPSLQINADD